MREGNVDELTQHDEQSPKIQITGSEAEVRAALDGQKIDSLEVGESGNVLLTLETFEQSDVDRCVDALRAQGLSIVSIEQKKQTLEDAFLDVVLPPELGA